MLCCGGDIDALPKGRGGLAVGDGIPGYREQAEVGDSDCVIGPGGGLGYIAQEVPRDNPAVSVGDGNCMFLAGENGGVLDLEEVNHPSRTVQVDAGIPGDGGIIPA